MMQRTSQQSSRTQQEASANTRHQQFLFPVLPFDDSLRLQHSKPSENSYLMMAPQPDEISVDGLSSFGDAWEEVEDSENGTHSLSRQLTPMSERIETLDYGVSSFMSNATDNERLHTPLSEDGEDGEDDPSRSAENSVSRPAILEQPAYIKVQEKGNSETCVNEQAEHDLEHATQKLFELTRDELEGSQGPVSEAKDSLSVYLELCLGHEPLSTKSPFDVVYVGPREMRSTLVQKIGAALTARSGNGPRQIDIDSSRVTVVPVSDFHSDASPEVVLIDSFGVDMRISDCRHALEDTEGTITLALNGDLKVVSSHAAPDGSTHTQPQSFAPPDLAIIFISEFESQDSIDTRLACITFMKRLKVPILVVSDTIRSGLKFTDHIDSYLPCMAARSTGSLDTHWRFPIELNTFLALDAGQLNRSLACALRKKKTDNSRFFIKLQRIISIFFLEPLTKITHSAKDFETGFKSFHSNFPGSLRTLWFSWIAQVRGRPTYYSASLAILLVLQIVAWVLQPNIMTNPDAVSKVFDPLRVSVNNLWMVGEPTSDAQPLKDPLLSKKIHEISIRQEDSPGDLQALTKGSHGSKNVYLANIVGDSHVIVTHKIENAVPPRNFPKIKFAVRRNGQYLVHNTSKVSEGVYLIELPTEDAYGAIDIDLWRSSKPKVNETLTIDLGTPWFKISMWLNSVQRMKEHTARELLKAHKSIEETFSVVNEEVSDRFRQASHVLSEFAEGVDQTSRKPAKWLQQTRKTLLKRKSSFRRRILNVKHVLHTKLESMRMKKEALAYSKQLVKASEQVMHGKASLLYPRKFGNGFQKLRKRHLRKLEKKLLQTWWRLGGRVPVVKDRRKSGTK